MSFLIETFYPESNKEWDKFIDISENGTIFNERKFLSYHKKNSFKDHSLVIKYKENIVAVIPFNEVNENNQTELYSHQGASFGGLVYRNISLQKVFDYTACLVEYFQKKKISKVCINLAPNVYNQHLNDYFQYTLLQNGFHQTKQELTSIISLKNLQQDFILDFNNKARTNIRKAQKNGLTVSFTNDLKAFNSILETTFWEKHQIRPTHSLEEIKTLMSLYPTQIRIMGVFKDQNMIGGSLLFLCNPRVVLTFYLVADANYQELRPLNILVNELIKWSRENKYSYIDFGTITQLGEVNLGLTKFKENFSAFGIFRNSLTLDL